MHTDCSTASTCIFFHLSISKKHCWKILKWELNYNRRPWPIHRVCQIDKYCWCYRFDEPIHNVPTCVPTSLIHYGGQLCFQLIHDKWNWGYLLPKFPLTVTWGNGCWCRFNPFLCQNHPIFGLQLFLWSWGSIVENGALFRHVHYGFQHHR